MPQDSVEAIGRLTAIKRQTLEELRSDLSRLDAMVEQAMRFAAQHREVIERFKREMSEQEQSGVAMNAEQMMGRRAYAAHLESELLHREDQQKAATVQRDEARGAFEAMYAEIRLLERLAERKNAEAAHEQRRRAYVAADDGEMIRHERMRRLIDADA